MGVTDIKYIVSDERIVRALLKDDYIRPSLTNLKGKRNLIGVEIGVQLGVNAYSILTNYDIKTLYLIDPYTSYKQTDNDKEEVDDVEAEMIRLKAVEFLSPFSDKIVWIREPSQKAGKYLPFDLDFAYIDGYHVWDVLRDDIDMCYHRIKKGGLLAGHDVNKEVVREVVMALLGPSVKMRKRDWWMIK